MKLRPSKWDNSCDNCTHQEGRHYCLILSKTMKNMDTVSCEAFKRKKASDRRSNNERSDRLGGGSTSSVAGDGANTGIGASSRVRGLAHSLHGISAHDTASARGKVTAACDRPQKMSNTRI